MKRIIAILLFYLLWACGPRTGSPGLGTSMEDAISKGIYLREYITHNDTFEIAGVQYPVRNIWLEKAWEHNVEFNNGVRVIPNYYRLQIDFEEGQALVGYKKDWTLGVDTKFLFNQSSANSLFASLHFIPSDTIKIPVQEGISLNKQNQIIIGEVVLYKK